MEIDSVVALHAQIAEDSRYVIDDEILGFWRLQEFCSAILFRAQ